MFGPRYFGPRYWGGRYWAPGSTGSPAAGRYWGPRYFGGRYWGPLYWPGVAGNPAPPPPPLPFRESLWAALKADAGVAAVVGANVVPLRIPEVSSLPALVYQLVGDSRAHHLRGPNGLARARVQFTVASTSLLDGQAGAEALRQLLDGYAGTLGPAGGVTLIETLLDDERDFYDPPVDASDRGVFRTVIDYVIRYREPKPARLSS